MAERCISYKILKPGDQLFNLLLWSTSLPNLSITPSLPLTHSYTTLHHNLTSIHPSINKPNYYCSPWVLIITLISNRSIQYFSFPINPILIHPFLYCTMKTRSNQYNFLLKAKVKIIIFKAHEQHHRQESIDRLYGDDQFNALARTSLNVL